MMARIGHQVNVSNKGPILWVKIQWVDDLEVHQRTCLVANIYLVKLVIKITFR